MPLRFVKLTSQSSSARREVRGLFALTLILMVPLFGMSVGKRSLGRMIPAIHQRLNRQLWEAAAHGDASSAQNLLDWGADLDVTNTVRQTALSSAVQNRHSATTQLLLNRGANPNLIEKNGIPPLVWAVDQWRNPQIVKAMLKRGGNPNSAATPSRRAVLFSAVVWRDSAIVQLLLNAGAKPDARDSDNRTPLLEAVVNEDILTVKALLSKGANPNVVSKHGAVPLLATLSSHRRNRDGYSCLPSCVHERMFRLMMQHGGNTNVLIADGSPALFVAVGSGDERLVKEFVKRGADVNGHDSSGQTPLMFAPDHLVPVLMALGADANLKSRRGKTAREEALSSGNHHKADLIAQAVRAHKH